MTKKSRDRRVARRKETDEDYDDISLYMEGRKERDKEQWDILEQFITENPERVKHLISEAKRLNISGPTAKEYFDRFESQFANQEETRR